MFQNVPLVGNQSASSEFSSSIETENVVWPSLPNEELPEEKAEKMTTLPLSHTLLSHTP